MQALERDCMSIQYYQINQDKIYLLLEFENFFTPPTCFGKTNEITITNVKWVSEDEYDSDCDSDSGLSSMLYNLLWTRLRDSFTIKSLHAA